MASNYSKFLYNDYEKALSTIEKLKSEKREDKKIISSLQVTVNTLNNTVEELNKLVKDLKDEILKLKAKNDKDSSNSSKPSSTNGYKKVITNRREKSNTKQDSQKGHNAHTINSKLNQFINSGNIEEEIIEINKNEDNKNKRFIEKIVIDIKITKTLKRYRYYPNKDGKYNIPKIHNQNIKYGSFIKAISMDLINNLYNSTDGVTRFIEDITNGGITLSKGTLIKQSEELSNKLQPQISNIEEKLLNSYYLNHDESQIKVDGDGYNILCACNRKHTRLWVSKHKSQEALDEIGFLPKFKGVIVKDGTELYNKYGCFLSQCLSHIQRYLKGIYDFVKNQATQKLSKFLSKCNTERNILISKGKTSFDESKYNSFMLEYDSIIDDWEKELREDVNNYLFDDEERLWTRMKYDNKKMDKNIRGDRDEILYFLKDFKVPATNNAAESSQRGVKVKQKVGKFRSVDGAENYSVIKSCILTYKKNDVNVLNSLIKAFNNDIVII